MTTDPPGVLRDRSTRHTDHVTYSVLMIADIARSLDGALKRQDWLTVRCMIDAFYVHLRLLAEFLLRGNVKDIGPSNFGIKWDPPQSEEALRLDDYWNLASKHVVHFGHDRVLENQGGPEGLKVRAPELREMAGTTFIVFNHFVKKVELAASQSSEAEGTPATRRGRTDTQQNTQHQALKLRGALNQAEEWLA